MTGRLKFYGWGLENTGFDAGEKERLFQFIRSRLGVEVGPISPPQVSDVALPAPRFLGSAISRCHSIKRRL